MSKKSKGVVFDSTPSHPYMYEDAKARLKHQTLLQDYEEFQRETDVMRSKLEATKQRKLILAAEVRFLRRRYKYLVKTKNTNSSHKQNLVQVPNPLNQNTKVTTEHPLTRKAANQRKIPPVSEPNSKKKHRVVKQVAPRGTSPTTDQTRKKISYGGKEAKGHSLSLIPPPVLDTNHKGILHKERIIGTKDAKLRNSTAAFDLNQASTPSGKEASLPTRAPIFDLNEISTGEEDFHGNDEATKSEEVKRSLILGINEEQHNDLKLSICRNSGEGSNRTGKRKISWQDPVALRV